MILLGFQHVITMFPATVLCALLMGFDVSTVLTVTGLGTIVALVGSKLSMGKYIPLYYGSSFSYIAAVTAITQAKFGEVAPDRLLSIVQAGFIATGVINVVVGLIIRLAGGKQALDKVLPPVITGSVACTIGIGLGAAALNMASGVAEHCHWRRQLVDRGHCHLAGCHSFLGLPARQGLYRHVADSAGRDCRLHRRHPVWPGEFLGDRHVGLDHCAALYLPRLQ
jgi:xanthine/uracil permease